MSRANRGFYEFFAGGGMVNAGLGPDWRCLLANDISPMKARAYRANWGDDHFLLGDIAAIADEDLPGRPSLVWGSSPCQDLSLAGSRKGLLGDRSGLFWAFKGVVDRLSAEGRPASIVAFENVCGLISSNKGADFRAVCAAFAQSGHRFGAMVLDARFWLPQSRPRLFLVAIADGVEIPAGLTQREPQSPWHTAGLVRAVGTLDADVARSWIWWAPGAAPLSALSLIDILEDAPVDVRMDTQAKTGRLIAMMDANNHDKIDAAIKRSRATGLREVGALYRRTRNGVSRVEIRFDGVAGCLRTPSGGSSRQSVMIVDQGRVASRLISSREAARLMGLAEDYSFPGSYNDAYHVCGDGVAAPVVRFLDDSIFTPILTHAASLAERPAGPQSRADAA